MSGTSKKRDIYCYNFWDYVPSIIFLCAALFFWATQSKPVDPLILKIFESFKIFVFVGIICIWVYVAMGLAIDVLASNKKEITDFFFWLKKFTYGAMVYSFILWAIGTWGEQLKTSILNNPENSVAYGISLILAAIFVVSIFSSLSSLRCRSLTRDTREQHTCSAAGKSAGFCGKKL